ncbi:hypothetical protein BY996DRAFT_2773062 [Phakopsora pachyrhizi]|nr:hypothetical protein BY996DRAFT_2773062 [Phakopsora pachyrhizi]
MQSFHKINSKKTTMSEKKFLNITTVQSVKPPASSNGEAPGLSVEMIFFNLARAAVLAAPPIIVITFVVELLLQLKPLIDLGLSNIPKNPDPNSPLRKIAGFAQKKLQFEVDVIDIIVTIGLVVLSFVITTILNVSRFYHKILGIN